MTAGLITAVIEMGRFEIALLRGTPRLMEEGQQAVWGCIRIGAFEEKFLSYIEFWTERDYERSWTVAIDILLSGATKSALITDAHDPEKSGISTIWPMYRIGEDVFIQNQILLPDIAPRPFTLEQVIRTLGPREIVDEEGETISEWQVELRDLVAFRSQVETDPKAPSR